MAPVGGPAAPPETDEVALVPAPGVTEPLLPAELVSLHAAASISVAAAPSRRMVNVDVDRMTCPVSCLGEASQCTVWEHGIGGAQVHPQGFIPGSTRRHIAGELLGVLR
jgi:hypothetical protein